VKSPRLCLLFLILRPQADEHALVIWLSLTKQCLSQLNINRSASVYYARSTITPNQVSHSGSLNCVFLFVLPIEIRHQRQKQTMAQSHVNVEKSRQPAMTSYRGWPAVGWFAHSQDAPPLPRGCRSAESI
jgi:hypothetical protein